MAERTNAASAVDARIACSLAKLKTRSGNGSKRMHFQSLSPGSSDHTNSSVPGKSFLRLAQEPSESIVDGPGLRLVVFCQGCPHRCPGCHNPQTHLMNGGKAYSLIDLLHVYQANSLLSGVTFSGGEPFEQGYLLARMASRIHEWGGNVISYSGYTLEKLRELAIRDEGKAALLAETDLLIDGPFILAQKSLELPFRGSRNQRLLPLNPRGQDLLRRINQD